MAKSPVTATRKLRVGVAPAAMAEKGESIFWSLEDGQTAKLTILVDQEEIVSVDQYAIWEVKPAPVWVDIGDNDPGQELGLKPAYRAFVPVLVNDETEPKLWSVGIGVHRDLYETGTMSDGLKGLIVNAKRTGSGLKTRYKVLSTGKRAKTVPAAPTTEDIVKLLGPDTREEIISLIEERTGQSYAKLKASMTEDDEVSEVSF